MKGAQSKVKCGAHVKRFATIWDTRSDMHHPIDRIAHTTAFVTHLHKSWSTGWDEK